MPKAPPNRCDFDWQGTLRTDYGGAQLINPEKPMEPIVRALDVGFGHTKFVTGAEGGDVRCAHFPSIAYPTETDESIEPMGGRRKTVGIPIDGLIYEVGPDVHLAADVFNAKQMHERYSETPEYLALLRGALHYMKVDRIDLLVVGLPVATFKAKKRAALEKLVTGRHDLGRGRWVHVERARVVPQPQGALMYYGHVHNRVAEVRKERSLIIDPGARTFDWLVTQGMQLVEKKSHSVNRGMFDVLQAIACGIGKATGTQFREYDLIDIALRGGKNPVIFQQEYDLSKHLPLARKIAEQAVGEMLHYVGDASDIKNIILVGGGAFFFKKAIKEAFPKHRIHELKDPLYANVKGFQLAGVEYAKTLIASASGAANVGAENAGT
jgi:plasmid segregation protein ParM